MTTNNHPANGPVSLDRLHQISEILSKAAAQSDGGNLGYAMADAVKVIDEVLSIPANLPCPVHLEPGLKFGKGVPTRLVLGALRRRADHYAELDAMTPEQRAEHDAGIEAIKAMLPKPAQPDIEMLASALTNAPLAPSDSQGKPRAPENCVTAEHRRVIEMLLNVCGAAFELADDSCQQDVDGEECNVVPSDAFKKLSDALDEIENTLPTEDIDRPDVFLAWSAMPRASLKSLLHAGNSPVTQDGWQLVPKEPTAVMNKAGWAAMNEHDAINPTYRAMLAAAPQQEVKSALEHGMQRYAGAMQKLSEGDK
ncbi:hypothetical protein [Citrobacter freundii]|uniref:hypothetical protein n=1 Tax=Citrobacter freundii TaxID=546 RepID=UPI003890796B